MSPPPSTAWSGNWTVPDLAAGTTDHEGWTYGPSFEYLQDCIGAAQSSSSWRTPVRRRRWTRRFDRVVKPPPPPTTPVTPSAPTALPTPVTTPFKPDELQHHIARLTRQLRGYAKLTQSIGTPQDSRPVRDTLKRCAVDLDLDVTSVRRRAERGPVGGTDKRVWQQLLARLAAVTDGFAQARAKADMEMRVRHLPKAAAGGVGAGSGAPATTSGSAGSGAGRSAGRGAGSGSDGRVSVPQMSLSTMQVHDDVAVRAAIIEERAEEIDHIHSGIHEIHDMYKDLAMMVQDQEPALHTLEKNLDSTHKRTRKGVKHLEKAEELQAKGPSCVVQ